MVRRSAGELHSDRNTDYHWRWETSREGAELLLSYGIEYDHSMSHHDCQPYYLRTGDSWTKIDYSKKAEEWMKPLVSGQETGLVEIPANWYLDVSRMHTTVQRVLLTYPNRTCHHTCSSRPHQIAMASSMRGIPRIYGGIISTTFTESTTSSSS
jgi:hypothetical protein